MTIRAGSAYADLGHVERTWATMLSTCSYLVPCMHSFALCTRGWRRKEEQDDGVCAWCLWNQHQPRIRYPVPIKLTRTSIAT